MKRKTMCLFMSLALLLGGCEYELGENYVELEKPSAGESEVNITTNLYLTNNEGQYVITKNCTMEYEVKVPGYRIVRCVFSMGNKRWERNRDDDRFITIDVNEFPNNVYELSCEVYGQRLDGSVAGLAIDWLAGKKTWPIRVLTRDSSNEPLPYRIDENGNLEISWTIDEKQREVFDHYEIYYSNYQGGALGRRVYNFDVRTNIYHLSGGSFLYDQCEVFFYPKAVTARPYSLGRAWLYGLKSDELLNNPTKPLQ